MSEWTSLHEILQDLSVAQGCTVPADLETFNNGGPPAMTIEEESGEHPLYQCDGGGDFEAPDYSLIQQMLHMVRENKDNSLPSDLNPLTPEFVPLAVQKKVKKNAALSSIISSNEAKLAASRPIPMDVIPVMFKRKSSDQVRGTRSTTVSPKKKSSPEKLNQYVPSTLANEYYNKYLEKNQLRDQFEQDIWSRTEQQMKEIDEKNKSLRESMSPREFGFKLVELQQHRHLLSNECVVCLIASKHGYEFDDMTGIHE